MLNLLRFYSYKMFTELCKNPKLDFSDFSKKILAPLACSSSLPIKLICCGSFNLVCLLKSVAINLQFFFT